MRDLIHRCTCRLQHFSVNISMAKAEKVQWISVVFEFSVESHTQSNLSTTDKLIA